RRLPGTPSVVNWIGMCPLLVTSMQQGRRTLMAEGKIRTALLRAAVCGSRIFVPWQSSADLHVAANRLHRRPAPINRKCPAGRAGTGNTGGCDGTGTSEIQGCGGAGGAGVA